MDESDCSKDEPGLKYNGKCIPKYVVKKLTRKLVSHSQDGEDHFLDLLK